MADLQRKTANLFDKNNADIYPSTNVSTESGSWNAYTGVAKTVRIACSANTTYAISIDSTIEQTIFRGILINSNDVPVIGTPVSGTGIISSSDDNTAVFTTLSDTKYIVFQFSANIFDDAIDSLMLNLGSTPLPYEPYGWVHSLRKLTTATDTFTTLPVNVYADGNTATVGISGNTVQSGTPTPDDPIMPEGCGDLETVGAKAGQFKIPISSANTTTPIYLGEVETTRRIKKLVLTGEELWGKSGDGIYSYFGLRLGDSSTTFATAVCTHYENVVVSKTSSAIGFMLTASSRNLRIRPNDVENVTVNDFISYLAQQYANGTPVTVWYALETPETAAVNEPLMKIGDYADTLSNAASIPTTEGANSITVDTTIQPSEFTATWTGWHNAGVKEKSENLFDTFDIVGQVPSISNGQLINYNGSTTSLIPITSGDITVTKPPTALLYLLLYAADMSYIGYVQNSTDANFYGSSVTGYENAKYCRLRIDRTSGLEDIQIMLNTGSTALPYEPYWK